MIRPIQLPCEGIRHAQSRTWLAAGQREADKRARWRAIGEVAGATFVQFVVEATGRLGPAANKVFNEKLISRDGPYTARMFARAEDEFCHSEVECAHDPQGKRA